LGLNGNVKTAEDIVKGPNGVELLLQKREMDKDNAGFLNSQPTLFAVGVVAAMILLAALYFCSSISKVQSISVSGCNYLSRQYVEKLTGVTLESRYYLTLPTSIEARVKKDPMIQSATVEMHDSNVISVTIMEKQPVGYRYDGDTPYILMSDGTKAQLTSDYMSIISRVPFIEGFTEDEQTHLLTTGLASVDRSMIEEIAQISQYQLEYDDQALELQMRDGIYVFMSYYTLDKINRYHEIYENLTDKSKCIFADGSETSEVAYASACPWNEVEVQHDYWTDASGNYILNKYGDKVIKHYYRDASGQEYLDENGYPIAIPVDENGDMVEDQDFKANYDAGYYAKGYLIYPGQEDAAATPTPTPAG